jgi:hypothetical protein
VLCGLSGLTAATYFATHSAAAAYPPVVVPAGTPTELATRIVNLHRTYDAAKRAGGVVGLRTKVASDIATLSFSPEWLTSIMRWIVLAGWNDAADLLINIAEVGGATERISASAYLSSKSTPLLTAASHGTRLIALHTHETEPLAKASWSVLRKQLRV